MSRKQSLKIMAFFLTVFILPYGCLFSQEMPTAGVEEEAGQSAEVVQSCLYHFETDDQVKELINLYNMITNAISYGVVTNGIRNGSGTNAISGLSLPAKAEGPYYQALSLLSHIDWDFTRALYHDQHLRPLPQWIGGLVGPLLKEDLQKINAIADPSLRPLQQLIESLNTLLPGRPILAVKNSSQQVQKLQAPLLKGLHQKLLDLEKISVLPGNPDDAQVINKLSSMEQFYLPLAGMVEFHLPEKAKEAHGKVELYLPALHELKMPVLTDPKSWTLQKGIPKRDLPEGPLVTWMATIDKFSYLQEAKGDDPRVIKIAASKDFKDKSQIKVRVTFGRLKSGRGNDVNNPIEFDSSEPEDSLKMYGKIYLPLQKNDGTLTSAIKKWLNKKMQSFELEVRFHQVTLKLKRRPESTLNKEAAKDHGMNPTSFIMDETKISFRLKRQKLNQKKMKTLSRRGFTCTPRKVSKSKKTSYDCFQDFATWGELQSEFIWKPFKDSKSSMLRGLGGGLQKTMGNAVRYMTNLDLVKSLPELQREADENLTQKINQILQEGNMARKILLDSLHAKGK